MEPDGYISCGVRFAASGETLEGDFHVGLIVSQIRKKVIAHGASPFGPLHEPAFSVPCSPRSLFARMNPLGAGPAAADRAWLADGLADGRECPARRDLAIRLVLVVVDRDQRGDGRELLLRVLRPPGGL